MSKNVVAMPSSLAKTISRSILVEEKISVLVILALGGFLRLYHLDGYGLWSDEFVTEMIVSKDSLLDMVKTCFEIPQPMPPFYFLIDRLAVSCLGLNEISLRLPSAIFSLLTVYLVFSIGKTLFNAEIGAFGALLCAINSTQIVYAQNARPYALCLFLCSASILAFLKWLPEETPLHVIGYVLSTTLLFYTHYIFFPLIFVQNLYFFFLLRSRQQERNLEPPCPGWRQWITLQSYVGLMVLPLFPQISKIIEARRSLNWALQLPQFKDFFLFLNPSTFFFSAAITLLLLGVGVYFRGVSVKCEAFLKSRSTSSLGIHPSLPSHSLMFLMLWYLVPLSVFFFLARTSGINLFVERYLILSSLPCYLLVPSLALCLVREAVGRIFLAVFLLYYIAVSPAAYFYQKGEFSPGVPGGNEWRETLAALKNPEFSAPLFLFQSPFIESDQLNFDSDPMLLQYLSAPLHSFYAKDLNRTFVLLPLHWWVDSEPHRKFKLRMKDLISSQGEFVLLANQEFWDHFQPWMSRELSTQYRVKQIKGFTSSGAMRLKRIKLCQRLKE
jgi:4-amino-4-deoxy-L-arabinose transferase-like glycosyltransferase